MTISPPFTSSFLKVGRAGGSVLLWQVFSRSARLVKEKKKQPSSKIGLFVNMVIAIVVRSEVLGLLGGSKFGGEGNRPGRGARY